LLIHQSGLGQRSRTVRRANLSAIARELHLNGPLSRSELVVRTGLTRSAIRGLIGELAAAGLVAEEGASSTGAPGRPSMVVRPEPTAAVVLAIEVAVDSMAAAVVGFGGGILGSARVDRRRGHQAAGAVVADLTDLCRPLLETSGRAARFVGSGVAVAGLVRSVDGLVAMAPNIGWRDIPIGPMIEAELQTGAPVLVANDADLGVLAELRRGSAVGAHDVLYISGEVGVGGGLVIGGRPLMGKTGYGGEVGHMTVNPHGSLCRCGSVGCWETEVGEETLLRLAGAPADGGREAVAAVLLDAAAGSLKSRAALDHVGRWLGIGLASLVNVFDPELIVLGGLFGRILPHVNEPVADELDRRVLSASRSPVRVTAARLQADAPLLGAAESALEPLLADPAAWLLPRSLAARSAIA
jgi:predicted NBD/HSP70 family sugar kinase